MSGRVKRKPRTGPAPARRPGPALLVVGAVAVIAALAVVGFLIFRAEPWDEALVATVGPVEITEAEVAEVVAAMREFREAEAQQLTDRLSGDPSQAERDAFLAQQLAGLEDQLAEDRDRVVEMRILVAAGQAYADSAGLTVPPPDPGAAAEDTGLPAEHPYARLVAEFLVVMAVLQAQSEPAEPVEADQREVYDHLVADGLTEASYAEARPVLTAELLSGPVGLRDLLVEVVDAAEVRVNPRYQPVYRVPVPMGEGASWLAVPLGEPAER